MSALLSVRATAAIPAGAPPPFAPRHRRRPARPGRALMALLILWFTTALAASLPAAEFIVAPQGDDTHDGTAAHPLRTLAVARDAARQAGPGPHRIVVRPGDYFLSAPLELDARDQGLTIAAEKAGTAILYGGKLVTGWRREGATWWSADLPEVRAGRWDFRALLVNGRLAVRARLPATGTLRHQSV